MSEKALALTELSYTLIKAAEDDYKRAQLHRDTVLAATLAAAGIEQATVLRIDGSEDSAKVLYYTTPEDTDGLPQETR